MLVKVLANILKLVIWKVILECQTTFVKERHILDGILIANEVMDFKKAYDSVEWDYLNFSVMSLMQFPFRWMRLIMECLQTDLALMLVNGSPTSKFLMHHGF